MAEMTEGSGAPPDGAAGGQAPPPDRIVCSVCGKPAPETRTDYTLISSEHAWRQTISRAADGSRVTHWICKECWDAQHQPS